MGAYRIISLRGTQKDFIAEFEYEINGLIISILHAHNYSWRLSVSTTLLLSTELTSLNRTSESTWWPKRTQLIVLRQKRNSLPMYSRC